MAAPSKAGLLLGCRDRKNWEQGDLGLDAAATTSVSTQLPTGTRLPVGRFKLVCRVARRQALYGTVPVVSRKVFSPQIKADC